MSNPNTVSKSLAGHLTTLAASAAAWAVTNGYLNQEAADFVANGLEPVLEGLVTLLVFLATYAIQRMLRAKGFHALADLLRRNQSKLPLLLLLALLCTLLLPACNLPLTGTLGYYDPGSGAKAGLTLDQAGTPTLRLGKRDQESGQVLTLEVSGK